MADYSISGVTLHIPDKIVTMQLDRALATGRYEHSEAEALLHHLRPKDRYLDLGAGAGFLLSVAAKAGASFLAGVEAGPETVKMARDNLARNGGSGDVLWGAVVGDHYDQDTVTFTVRRSFWASTLTPPADVKNSHDVSVPALRFGDLLARTLPSVLSVDIEGGEADLFQNPLPDVLRLIILELHPSIYKAAGVKVLFDRLSCRGFVYCPTGSVGATVVFQRLTP